MADCWSVERVGGEGINRGKTKEGGSGKVVVTRKAPAGEGRWDGMGLTSRVWW
jgi:hypothetical protein